MDMNMSMDGKRLGPTKLCLEHPHFASRRHDDPPFNQQTTFAARRDAYGYEQDGMGYMRIEGARRQAR